MALEPSIARVSTFSKRSVESFESIWHNPIFTHIHLNRNIQARTTTWQSKIFGLTSTRCRMCPQGWCEKERYAIENGLHFSAIAWALDRKMSIVLCLNTLHTAREWDSTPGGVILCQVWGKSQLLSLDHLHCPQCSLDLPHHKVLCSSSLYH